jgi:cyclopropane fatty-acyl-phospholipid synthase-like methyltransferase
MAERSSDHIRRVQRYYDANTGRFLKWGRDEGTANLHAALWPAGVRTLAAAMQHSNELIARAIAQSPVPVARVLDLGCGVGAGLFYLGRRLPRLESLVGVTLSPLQEARRRAGSASRSQASSIFPRRALRPISPTRSSPSATAPRPGGFSKPWPAFCRWAAGSR